MQDQINDTDIAIWRRQLIFRAWHRGTREMDLLMGSFADAHVPSMDSAELALFEDILLEPDPDVYDWISGRIQPPANKMNPVLEKLCHHRFANVKSGEQP